MALISLRKVQNTISQSEGTAGHFASWCHCHFESIIVLTSTQSENLSQNFRHMYCTFRYQVIIFFNFDALKKCKAIESFEMAILPHKFSKETLPEAIPCPKRLAEQLRFSAIFLKFLEYFVHSGTKVQSGSRP